MRKVLVRDNGGRIYFPVFRVSESGLSDSRARERREGDSKGNKWRKNNRKHGMQEGDSGEGGRDKGTGDDRSRCDRRKDEGKKGTESRYDQTEVNNKDDDRKKRGKKERKNRESGRGKVSNQEDAKRRSYSEAVIEGALRTERVFMGDSILRKTDRTLSKGEDIVVCLPGARIEHVTERVENVLGHGQGGSILVHVGTNNADRDGTTKIVQRYRQLVETLNKTRVEQIILSGILPVMRGRGATYRNCKNMAINALVEQMCEEEGVGFVDLWGYFVGKEDMYMRDGCHLSGKGAAVFSENLLRSMDRGTDCSFLN